VKRAQAAALVRVWMAADRLNEAWKEGDTAACDRHSLEMDAAILAARQVDALMSLFLLATPKQARIETLRDPARGAIPSRRTGADRTRARIQARKAERNRVMGLESFSLEDVEQAVTR
jgi:hypothetical protein